MLGRKKSQDHRAFDLSEKSSHSAASIARAPDSHCCQLRCVRCTSAEASAVESPADSRACRISDGVGLFGIDRNKNGIERGFVGGFDCFDLFMFEITKSVMVAQFNVVAVWNIVVLAELGPVVSISRSIDICGEFASELFGKFKVDCVHDLLRLIGLRCATHDFNIANAVRLCKSYFASNQNNFVRAA
jgi:hypothetical protein